MCSLMQCVAEARKARAEDAGHAAKPMRNDVYLLIQMLSKHHCHDYSGMDLQRERRATATSGGALCCIISDSTIMPNGCSHLWVTHRHELLGPAAGLYGCGFFDGSFDRFKAWLMSGEAVTFASPVRVAYVPAEGFKAYDYEKHARSQEFNLAATCIRTPSINAFAKAYRKLTGSEMIRSKGPHLTEPGRKWFAGAWLQGWDTRIMGKQMKQKTCMFMQNTR